MKRASKTGPPTTASVRQSVTIPARLAVAVERGAKKRHLTISSALVVLAERGLEAEAEARANLDATYRRFMSESDPARKGEGGKDLIRAVFGKDASAEDPFLQPAASRLEHIPACVEERRISLQDLRRLQEWVNAGPTAPEGDWFKDFGSLLISGSGSFQRLSSRRA